MLASLERRHRVVRFDHRGHGRSPLPQRPWQIADLGGDVLALLDRLGLERVSYCRRLAGRNGRHLAPRTRRSASKRWSASAARRTCRRRRWGGPGGERARGREPRGRRRLGGRTLVYSGVRADAPRGHRAYRTMIAVTPARDMRAVARRSAPRSARRSGGDHRADARHRRGRGSVDAARAFGDDRAGVRGARLEVLEPAAPLAIERAGGRDG